MRHFAVIREAGPAWTDGGITAQPAMSDHAKFMNTLADEGLVVFAGARRLSTAHAATGTTA